MKEFLEKILQLAKNKEYDEMVNYVNSKQWIEAKATLDTLGNWKDSEKYISDIYYNYYLINANEEYKNQNLESSLDLYKKAKEYNSNDKNLDEKIKNIQNKSAINYLKLQSNFFYDNIQNSFSYGNIFLHFF